MRNDISKYHGASRGFTAADELLVLLAAFCVSAAETLS